MARQLMTMEQILSILRDTPERLRGLTGDLTEAKLHAAPESGEWSVTDIAAHLRSCADVWGQAIETIAVTDHPTIRAVSPTTWIESTDYRELAFASSLQACAKQRGCSLCSDSCQTRAGREAPPCSGVADHWSSPCIRMRTAWRVTSGLTGAGGEDGEGAAGLNRHLPCPGASNSSSASSMHTDGGMRG
jgi:hypothetical protein